MSFGKQKTPVLYLRSALIAAALTAFAVLTLPTAAEAQQTESTTVTNVQYNQKQVQRTDSVSDAQVSTQRGNDRKSGGANVTTKDGCVRAEAGDAVAEVGCDEQNDDDGNVDEGDGNEGGENGGGGNGGDEGGDNDSGGEDADEQGGNGGDGATVPDEDTGTETPNAQPGSEKNPLPQDTRAGPLEGAEAIGEDIDVEGDIIGTDPETGEPVVGIDTITINTENCEVTDPDDLSVTLRILDGGPGRFIDGPEGAELDNAEITVDEGQVVIRGQGPGNVVQPFFVEGQAQPGDIFVQDTFEVISSTGIGGEGCRALQTSDGPNDGSNDPQDAVVDEIDRDDPLPDTGGSELRVPSLEAALLAFSVLLGLAGWRLAARARL